MWSIGYIMFELYRGHTLFQTHDNLEHSAMMKTLPFRLETHKTRYYCHNRLDCDPESIDERYVREHCRKLKVSLTC